MKRPCPVCGTEYKTHQAWLRRNTGVTCSRVCGRILHGDTHGPRNPNWKGGRWTRKDGYVLVRVASVMRLEHVVLMEAHLGRRLTRGEVVHHVNRNKSDNRIENLVVLSNSAHGVLHAAERAASK